jgi:hypothetical protein
VYVRKRTWLYEGPRRPGCTPRAAGLGDAAACPANPCTWWDDVYLGDACMSYLQCADPTNPLLTLVQKGAIVGSAQILGQTAGQAVSTGFNAAFTNPDGSTNWTFIAVVGGVGLIALYTLMPSAPARRGRR